MVPQRDALSLSSLAEQSRRRWWRASAASAAAYKNIYFVENKVYIFSKNGTHTRSPHADELFKSCNSITGNAMLEMNTKMKWKGLMLLITFNVEAWKDDQLITFKT